MDGSVLSFLKAEWKVSDTGSAHWASSYFCNLKKKIFFLICKWTSRNIISIAISLIFFISVTIRPDTADAIKDHTCPNGGKLKIYYCEIVSQCMGINSCGFSWS